MKFQFLSLLLLIISSSIFAQTSLLEKEMGSYASRKNFTLAPSGNLYNFGGVTASEASNINIFPNAIQQNYSGGENDCYIEKRSPEGELLWNTFIGGEGREGIAGALVRGFVYVVGSTTSTSNISTPGAFMEDFLPNISGGNPSNRFIMKLNENGTKEWATYYRTTGGDATEQIVNYTTDNLGNFYIVGFTQSDENVATVGAFDESLGEASQKGFITKFDVNGSRVWGTYYGTSGSQNVTGIDNIAIDQDGNIIVGGNYLGNMPENYFNTSGTYTDGQNLPADVFLAKFDPQGNRLWGLMYGGIDFEQSIDVAVDSQNKILWFGSTQSQEDIASPGAYQETLGSSNPINSTNDAFLAKFDEDGNQIWSTYYGGQLTDSYGNGSGTLISGLNRNVINFDEDDNIYFASLTKSTNQIATPNTFQDELAAVDSFDSYVAKFNPQGERLWGTYFGGLGDDKTRGLLYAGNDEFYLFGETSSTEGIATSNAWYDQELESDVSGFIVKFIPNTLGITEKTNTAFSVWPNPTKETFTISGKANQLLQVSIYDLNGRKVHDIANVKTNSPVVLKRKLSTGIYFLNINAEENQVQNLKLIVD